MRSIVLLSTCVLVLGLGACGGETDGEGATPPEATAAGGEAAAPGEDERGTTGTAAPDGSGKPGTTLPTTPADSETQANPAAPD